MDPSFDKIYSDIAKGEFAVQSEAIVQMRTLLQNNSSLHMQKIDKFLALTDTLLARKENNWHIINNVVLLYVRYVPQPDETDKYLAFLIEVSYKITLSFFRTWTPSSTQPDLRYIDDFIQKYASISKETIFVFAKHCTLGFIQKASFLHYFIPHIHDVIAYVINCDHTEYDMLLEPLSSSDKQVQVYFLIVWVNAMGTLYKSFFARQALVIRAQSLFALNDDAYTSSGSTYLLEFTKSSPIQFHELLKDQNKLSIALDKVLHQLSHGSQTQLDQVSTDIVVKKQKTPSVQRAKALFLQTKYFFSSWEPMSLALIVEARVMMWGKTETQMKCGKAIGFSEIQSVSISDAQKKGVMNVLVIKSKAKEEYKFAFESQNITSQWANVLQSQKPK